MKRGKGFAASTAQRSKVAGEPGCRFCRRTPVDPAHVVSRARGGCNEPECVIALCREHHRQYDEGWLDVLSLLSKAEQAHAVNHIGIVAAYHQTTHQRIAA